MIDRIFLTLFSDTERWGGTKTPLFLLINRRGRDIATLEAKTRRNDPANKHRPNTLANLEGKSHLVPLQGLQYAWEVRDLELDPDDLDDVYLRVGAYGSDAWDARHALVIGQTDDQRPLPLALARDRNDVVLSRDKEEGVPSMPLDRVQLGTPDSVIDELLVVHNTSTRKGSESDSPFALLFEFDDQVREFEIVPERKRFRDRAHMHFIDLDMPMTRRMLVDNGVQFRLESRGDDWWRPDFFAVFGISGAEDGAMIPLVYEPRWDQGLSAEASDSGTADIEFDWVGA